MGKSLTLQTDQIAKLALNDKYSIEVHAYTGIEVLKVKGHIYERIFSDEELAAMAREKELTEISHPKWSISRYAISR